MSAIQFGQVDSRRVDGLVVAAIANGSARSAFRLPDVDVEPAPAPSSPPPSRTDASRPANLDEALAAFEKEARMTPQQRIRRDVLKDQNLTEEALEAMPPDQRKAVEDKIAPEIARRTEAAQEEARRQGKTVPVAWM